MSYEALMRYSKENAFLKDKSESFQKHAATKFLRDKEVYYGKRINQIIAAMDENVCLITS